MKSYLINRNHALKTLYDELFRHYPKEDVIHAVRCILQEVANEEAVEVNLIRRSLENILGKTETFNVLLTLNELDKRAMWDPVLQKTLNDRSYNQHRTIAVNICDMYGSGATSFFGYADCTFKKLFPGLPIKPFLSKGISALVGATVESVLSLNVEEDYTKKNTELLASRGIDKAEMVRMVYDLQKPYNSYLTLQLCEEHIDGVLRKQQTYHTVQLCMIIDRGIENKEFGDQFQAIVGNDEGLYGVDETVNTSISKMYGSIALTNFGYLDKSKPGIIGRLDSNHEGDNCNTYADDTVCAIVSAACARLAHNNANNQSKPGSA